MLIHSILLVLFAAASQANPSKRSVELVESNEIPQDDSEYRLPTAVIPTHYSLTLEPNFVNFDFQGEMNISIIVKEDVNEIKIHAQNLTFVEEATTLLDSEGNKVESVITTDFIPTTDFYILKFVPIIKAGKYELRFKYSGILHKDKYGFYRNSYINELGDKVWLATTQFEPTFARRAFPCFDEPALKATFKIRIRHFDNCTAISNMPAVSQIRPGNDLIRWETEFAETPPMSTYLVAFVVSDFKYLSTDDGKFRIIARSNGIKNGKYALEIGKKELDFMVDYMASGYEVPKMDNIAIPQYANDGAMENWGLITYSEDNLLFDENVTIPDDLREMTNFMAHEYAHQWFGNLVSPLWWDYTWLNEGLANYFQYYITDKVKTTWRYMQFFVVKNLQETSFKADDKEKQHAMDATVKSTAEIRKNFDSITYSKAGSVVRMFAHMMTEPAFQTAMRQYLNTHKFKTVTSDDLITSLLDAIPEDSIYKKVNMASVFEGWIRTRGFPVITVERNYTTKTATITQKRFLTNATSPPTELWIIPTNYATQNNPDFNKTTPTLWILKQRKSIDIVKGLPDKEWVIFNMQQTGYYRVNYDITNWKLIAEYLKNPMQMKNIHVVNRAQLLDDSFQLAKAGELPDFSVFLGITEHLKNEVDYIPWYPARKAFRQMRNRLTYSKSFKYFKLYMLKLMEKLESSLGYEDSSKDHVFDRMNRIDTVGMACEFGSTNCLSATHNQLLGYLEGSKNLSKAIRSTVFCSGIRSANATTWQRVYDLMARTKKGSEGRSELIYALGCSSNKDILTEYLESTLIKGTPISWGFAVLTLVLDSPLGSPIGSDVAFDFMTTNIKKIIKNDTDLSSDSFIAGRFGIMADRMTNKAQVIKLVKWIKTLATDEKYREFAIMLKKTVLPKALENYKWSSKHEPAIWEFLESQKLIEPKKTNHNGGSAPGIRVWFPTSFGDKFEKFIHNFKLYTKTS